jgi:hypothetical protein
MMNYDNGTVNFRWTQRVAKLVLMNAIDNNYVKGVQLVISTWASNNRYTNYIQLEYIIVELFNMSVPHQIRAQLSRSVYDLSPTPAHATDLKSAINLKLKTVLRTLLGRGDYHKTSRALLFWRDLYYHATSGVAGWLEACVECVFNDSFTTANHADRKATLLVLFDDSTEICTTTCLTAGFSRVFYQYIVALSKHPQLTEIPDTIMSTMVKNKCSPFCKASDRKYQESLCSVILTELIDRLDGHTADTNCEQLQRLLHWVAATFTPVLPPSGCLLLIRVLDQQVGVQQVPTNIFQTIHYLLQNTPAETQQQFTSEFSKTLAKVSQAYTDNTFCATRFYLSTRHFIHCLTPGYFAAELADQLEYDTSPISCHRTLQLIKRWLASTEHPDDRYTACVQIANSIAVVIEQTRAVRFEKGWTDDDVWAMFTRLRRDEMIHYSSEQSAAIELSFNFSSSGEPWAFLSWLQLANLTCSRLGSNHTACTKSPVSSWVGILGDATRKLPISTVYNIHSQLFDALIGDLGQEKPIYCVNHIWFVLERQIVQYTQYFSMQQWRHVFYNLVYCSLEGSSCHTPGYTSFIETWMNMCPQTIIKEEHAWVATAQGEHRANVCEWWVTSGVLNNIASLGGRSTLLRLLCTNPGKFGTFPLLRQTLEQIGIPHSDIHPHTSSPLVMEVCGYGKETRNTKWVMQTLTMMCTLTAADLTTIDAEGNSLLYCAIQTNNVQLVRSLCEEVGNKQAAITLPNYKEETIATQLKGLKRTRTQLGIAMQEAIFTPSASKKQKR